MPLNPPLFLEIYLNFFLICIFSVQRELCLIAETPGKIPTRGITLHVPSERLNAYSIKG